MAPPLPRAKTRYQGLICSDVEYTTKEGLAPAEGWVTLDPEYVNIPSVESILATQEKNLIIPWGARPNPELMPVDPIIFATRTFAGKRPLPDKGDAGNFFGLKPYGKLIFDSGEGPKTISGVFLHPDTAFEIGIRDRNGKQTIKIRLTDIRAFWPDFGECFGHVNVHQTINGITEFDPHTVLQDGKPLRTTAILAWLFFHLPGGLAVGNILEAAGGLGFESDIIREFESPYPIIQRVFQTLSLTLIPRPNGTFNMAQKQEQDITPIAEAPKINVQRTLERNYTPQAVRFVGGRLRRNQSRIAIPMSHTLQGGLDHLKDVIESVMDFDEALRQMTMPGSRQFEQIKNDKLRKIAKEDWGRLFQISTVAGYDGSIRKADTPILDPMFTITGTARTGVVTGPGGGTFEIGPESEFLADGSGTQEVRFTEPKVIGPTYGQRTLERDEFLVFLDELKGPLNESKTAAEEDRDALITELAKITAEIARLGNDGKTLVPFNFDFLRGPAELLRRGRRVQIQVDEKTKEISQIQAAISELDDILTGLRIRQDMAPKQRFWSLIPTREFQQGTYTLDRKLGLIRTHQPVGIIQPVVALHQEHFRIVAIPTLKIFYSVEYDTLSPADFYNAFIVAPPKPLGIITFNRGKGIWPEPIDAKLGQEIPFIGSNIETQVLKEKPPKTFLYIDENGMEFNGVTCDDVAFRKGLEIFSESYRELSGASITYEGWLLQRGDDLTLSSVTWKNVGGDPVTMMIHNSSYQSVAGTSSSRKSATTVAVRRAAGKGADSIFRVNI